MKRNTRIRHIFLTHCLPMITVILLFGLGAMTMSFTTTSKEARRTKTTQLQHVINHIDNVMSNVETINLMFSSNSQLVSDIEEMLSINSFNFDQYREMGLIRSVIKSAVDPRPEIDQISIYIPTKQRRIVNSSGLSNLDEKTYAEWFITYFDQYHLNTPEIDYITRKSSGRDYDVIRFSRPITSSTGEQKGVVALDIGHHVLEDAHRKFFERSHEDLKIRNERNEIIYDSSSSKKVWATEISVTSPIYGWTYTLSIDNLYLYRFSLSIALFTFIGIILSTVIGLLLTYRINREERDFLYNIMDQLKKAGASTIDESIEGKSVFQDLNDHILKNFIERDFLRIQKEAIEYRALQMQINPHFLFNTLDTINWKAIKLANGENDVSDMILLLSRLLKYSLHEDKFEGVELSEEIEELLIYIKLQEYRFKEKFTFKITAEDGIPEIKVPCMILQPLLENSFNHAFRKDRILNISLDIRTEEDSISIIILNDGIPISPEQVESLNSNDRDALQSSSSLGIFNTRKRLELFTKGNSSLIISSNEEKTAINITIRK